MPQQSISELSKVHTAPQQHVRQPQNQQQRRKTGRRDPKQSPSPRQKKDTVVIPPRQVEVDFNHGSTSQKDHAQKKPANKNNNKNNNKSNSKSNKSASSSAAAGTAVGSMRTPALPDGKAPNFGGNAVPNGIVKAAAEAMLSPKQSNNMDKYAGSSFQSEPKAITLPKPSFLRR